MRRRGNCFAELSTVVAPCSNAFTMPSATAASAGFKPVTKAAPGTAAGSSRSMGAAGGSARPGAAAAAAGGAARVSANGLFEPTVPGAVVVNGVQWQGGKGQLSKGRPVVPVVSESSTVGFLLWLAGVNGWLDARGLTMPAGSMQQ